MLTPCKEIITKLEGVYKEWKSVKSGIEDLIKNKTELGILKNNKLNCIWQKMGHSRRINEASEEIIQNATHRDKKDR